MSVASAWQAPDRSLPAAAIGMLVNHPNMIRQDVDVVASTLDKHAGVRRRRLNVFLTTHLGNQAAAGPILRLLLGLPLCCCRPPD
jgi:hypothetical protein